MPLTSTKQFDSLFVALRARPELTSLKLAIANTDPVDAVTPVYSAAQTELNALLAQFGLKPLYPTI